jgi:flagellar biosynthesis protein FlhF
MRIKTYVVDNVSEAYPLIQNDLGKDAFILKTKPLRKSGFLGIFQKKQFEVVAAADDSERNDKASIDPHSQELQDQKRFEELVDSLVPMNPNSKTKEQEHAHKILEALKNNNNAKQQLKADQPLETLEFEVISKKIQEQSAATSSEDIEKKIVKQSDAEQGKEAPKKRGRPKKTVEPIEEAVPIEAPKKRGRPKKSIESVEEAAPQEAPKKRGRPKKTQAINVDEQGIETSKGEPKSAGKNVEALGNQDSHQEVLKELSEVKGLIQAMAIAEQPTKMVPRFLEKWVEQLRDNEVDEEVIQFIIKRVSMKLPNPEAISSEKIEQTLFSVIEQLFSEGVDPHTTTSEAFIALVGPTGVGKTTTIAKLAAAQVIERRQKVGLLTTDTFRIAAVEQLKTYANILNAPFEVVDQAHELVPAMKSLKDCDVVFMDSAGRNYLEGEYIEEINQYLRLDVPQENYLVLSMTSRWRDMKKIVEQMKSVPIDKLILTKWDETTCFGVALNMVYHYPYPLSYLCLGQGVPDDIMKADPKFMAKKLLGVDDSETGPSTSFKKII